MIGTILSFMFGSIMGSFLNVCIYRMPLGKSVVWPGSHCPQCEKRINWYDNIPFVSYLLLGGACRFCKKHIPIRYLAVELLTALMFVLLYLNFAFSYDLFFYIVLVCCLIVATFVDIKHRIIPDEISVGGMIVGFILSTIRGVQLDPFSFSYKPMLTSLLGILIGGGIIYATGALFDLVYFKLMKRPPIQGETESMGGGDVKLLAMIGAFLGWEKALLTFFLAPFFGAIVGVHNLLSKKDHTIPYGPFLAVASLIALFWANQIIGFLLFR
ncbi:MAG: prepilin peptidase [Candidatus Omnitrophica bacterium]|nr:prepilin peptidase [Candidatus Omnitrophota bacterium]